MSLNSNDQRVLLLLFSIFASISTFYAQTPGNVSTNLGLWLKADGLPLGSSQTANWSDAHTSANHAVFNTLPVSYEVNSNINFNKSVHLNDEWFDSPLDISTTNDVNVFIIYRLDDNNSPLWGNGLSNTLSSNNDGRQAISNSMSSGGTTNTTYTGANTVNRVYLNHINSVNNSSSSSVYINGDNPTSFATTNIISAENKNVDSTHHGIFIGRENSATIPTVGNNELDIAEFIVYTGSLNTTQRERINSYLAIKYGITITDHNYVNSAGTVLWDNTANGSFNNDITGILRDNNCALNQSQSKSENLNSILTIEKTGLTNNQALLVGDNGGATNTSSSFTYNNFFAKGQRMNKVWKCQKTSGFNGFNINIDNSISRPAGFSTGNMLLLVADDAVFTTNLKGYPITNSGGTFTASNVQLENGQFFTLATSDGALWVKSDGNNTITSNQVNLFSDHVLGVNDMSGLSGTEPDYESSANLLNFHPYIRFNQGNNGKYLEKSNFIGFDDSGVSTFLVLRRDAANTSIEDEAILSYATGSSNAAANEIVIVRPRKMTVSVQEAFITGGEDENHDIRDNIPHVFTNVRGSNQNNFIRLDADGDDGNYKNSTTISSGGTLIFGQDQDNVGGGFDNNQQYQGDFAEAIIFNKRVSNNERNAVESYLAVKYGITLNSDYELSDNTTTWNQVTNGTYHRNIGGIGRDDAFELDQQKSTSQNGATYEVTIEHLGSFPSNLSHLIWGADNGDYDDVSLVGAPSGYRLSQKTWKVQNNGDQIGVVNVTLPIPPSLNGQNSSDLRLLVNANSNFSSGSVSDYTGTANAGGTEITFAGVPLLDGTFFALGISENVGYVNLDNGSPTTFEACPGSRVQFTYANLTDHPDEIEFRDTLGMPFTIPLVSPTNITHITNGSGISSGIIDLIIPSHTGTGNVRMLLTNGSVLYNFNGNLVVHNPKLYLFSKTSPICATDSTLLRGIPSGGVFSSIAPNLITNDTLVGPNLGWSAINDTLKTPDITYTYTPKYINGTPCLQSVSKTEPIEVRDNRLDELTFNYIIKNPPSSNRILDLDTVTISTITPNLLDSSFTFPISFAGTYVNNNSGIYEFLVDQAASNNPITLRYNNGGCIGEITSDLDVYPPLRIIGIVDTLCVDADTIQLSRDPLPDYRDTTYTTATNYRGIQFIQDFVKNRITSVVTTNPAYQGAIDTISSATNAERYSFNPNGLPSGPIGVEMHYTTTVDVTILILGATGVGSTLTYRRTFSVVAFDTIHIEPRPNPQILNLDPTYCPNIGIDTIRTSPDFEYSARTYFQFRGDDAFGYNLLDTLQQDTIFNPIYHYNKHVPAKNRHLNVELIYIVDRYGCVDRDTAYTRIIAPVQPIFYPQPAYCTSDFPTPLTPTFAPNSFTPFSAVATFLPAPGLDTVTRLFAPGIAGSGNHLATLQMIDNFGCRSEFTDTLFVRVPPQIRLEADIPSRTGFCSNETSVPLNTILLSGNPADTVVYFGAGVTANTLDPSAIFPGSNGGTSPISVVYTDSFGCEGRDDVVLTIRQIPSLKLDSLFNNNQRYCGNDPAFVIEGFVRDSVGQFQQKDGFINGSGVVLTNGIYYYTPTTILVDSLLLDTVRYSYTDSYGCSNTISETIRIDSIPEVSLTGLDIQYCIDDTIDQLFGLPDSNVLFNNIIYGGPGVNPNTGRLTPSLAGTGRKIVFYTFEDGNSCRNTVFDTTIIYGLPTPLFGGYSTQYCTAAALDTLQSLNLPLIGSSSFFFWGTIISDSTGIITPSRDSSGPKTIYYTFTDSVGCSNTSSENIFIHPSPEIVVDGLDSAYCFNDIEDIISVFPSGALTINSSPGFTSSGNNIFFDPDQDTAGIKTFTYIHTNPNTTCADTLSVRTLVYKPPTPSYTGLDNFYCETRDTFLIAGLPSGGTFNGQGIINTISSFSPAKAGGGVHVISYAVNDTLFYNIDTLVCRVDTITNVTVRPLPVPTILSPGNNFRFCNTDTSTILVNGTANTWNTFQSNTGGVQYTIQTVSDTISFIPLTVRFFPDTTYYFDPSLVAEGTHFVTYIATDSLTRCQDSIQYTYIVDDYTSPFFALDSVYCESSDSTILFGVPGGGVFFRNNDTLNGVPPYFVPNPGYASGGFLPISITDTIVYTVQDGACYGTDTQYVLINPVPQLSFRGDTTQTHNTYCLGTDSVSLTPNITGGIFTGNGVLFGTSAFLPDIAGAGHHPIYYDYVHPLTGCSNQYIDTFSVYGMPEIDFDAIGGCQLDSISFWPNNTILGLNHIFNNRIIDSITSITWEFEPGVIASGSHQNNVIDTISHVYSSPGIYQTKLWVTNQTYCTDTQTIRLVISPRVSSFPYDESFESSSANWYAESRDSSHSLLWEWGIDSTAQGIASNHNNRFWSTQLNTTYSKSEDAWVYSPCFDIDSLTRPMVKLDYWSDTRTAADGAVLEYQEEDGTWVPLGELNRGINWFNSSIITGQPGDQNLAPIGWSGKSTGWKDARYKLDALGNRSNVRFRVAFGSPSVDLGGTFYDGFGFDNFWVGSRTRNVLLETTANVNEPAMEIINSHVYQLVYNSPINEDLIMLQYHCEEPLSSDIYHLDNEPVANARTTFYGISEAGRAYIDGQTTGIPRSRYLQDTDFEKDMLVSPKFDIQIDTFHHNSAGIFTIEATVKALVNLPTPISYRINTVITEDSLSYPNGSNSMVHAVVRQDDQAANLRNRSWAIGDTETVVFSWNHGASSILYKPEHFQGVVFIQAQLSSEVFQAETSRDVSGYWVGVDQIAAESELNEINSMNLYPNPAKDYFNVAFDAPLKQDYNWKLVSINGVEHQSGTVYSGDQTVQINNYDFPTGVYIFMVYNGKVFSQRKVIINQE
jgi:hypothetical protein